VVETVPRTTFDVDLYDPKASDTYDSISQEYYNDKRYGSALRAFNDNKPLQGGNFVHVPPLYVLKKKFAGQAGVVPVGATSTPRSGSSTGAMDWGAPPKPDPGPARTTATGRGTYLVPQGGTTLGVVARQVGVDWRELYDLNAAYPPNTFIPAGTELRLPANAKLP
jgi:hypothetical protein